MIKAQYSDIGNRSYTHLAWLEALLLDGKHGQQVPCLAGLLGAVVCSRD